MPEKVILTGGVKTQYNVSVYNTKGFLENWPQLKKGRAGHGCGHYVNTDKKVVSVRTFSFRRKTSLVLKFHVFPLPELHKLGTFSQIRNFFEDFLPYQRMFSGVSSCGRLHFHN